MKSSRRLWRDPRLITAQRRTIDGRRSPVLTGTTSADLACKDAAFVMFGKMEAFRDPREMLPLRQRAMRAGPTSRSAVWGTAYAFNTLAAVLSECGVAA